MPGQDTPATFGFLSAGKIGIAVAVVAALVAVYALLSWSGMLDAIADGEAVRRTIDDLGIFGPLLIVGLLAMAIVFNPIPSAPIAIAAGAAYGHVWGTVYVVIGAELGALAAFAIARLVGYEVLKRWLGGQLSFGLLGSQNTLMAIVFASRLMPFLSFDLISYAAGLTPLRPWRFAVATLAGIIPISYLLAHFGGEIAVAGGQRFEWIIIALGGVTLIPVVVGILLKRRAKAKAQAHNDAPRHRPESDPHGKT